MQKQAPSVGRILVAAGFALSCFGLLLFLWIAFGGPVPLASKSYRITADFPEATTLAVEADVRIGGVNVGKVKELELAPSDAKVDGQDATRATIEIDPEFAPIAEDARAILRAKTLLGETYVELTSGSEPAPGSAPVSLGAAANVSDAEAEAVAAIPEGGQLGEAQVQPATQIDEIFNALDEETRESFRRWQANAAVAIEDRGLDLNDALGNLGPFVSDAADVLETLNRQTEALQGLVRDTGAVFEALTERDQELASVIVNSNDTFGALAQEERALAETFKILPTFEIESRLTFERLDQFQADAHPLIQDLIPVARELSPTLQSLREVSPSLKSLFGDLDVLVDASEDGLPALRRYLVGATPLLDALNPFLANLNPVLDFLFYNRHQVTDFPVGLAAGTSGTLNPLPDQAAPRHFLRILSNIHPSLAQVRSNANRGNGYLKPLELNSALSARSGIWPEYDCKNTDYTTSTEEGDPETQNEEQFTVDDQPPVDAFYSPCIITPDAPSEYGGGRVPNLFADP